MDYHEKWNVWSKIYPVLKYMQENKMHIIFKFIPINRIIYTDLTIMCLFIKGGPSERVKESLHQE